MVALHEKILLLIMKFMSLGFGVFQNVQYTFIMNLVAFVCTGHGFFYLCCSLSFCFKKKQKKTKGNKHHKFYSLPNLIPIFFTSGSYLMLTHRKWKTD